jgi:hypothetical protein
MTYPTVVYRQLQDGDKQALKYATDYEEKGHEYDAVCIVIPLDQDANNYFIQLDSLDG